MVLKSNQKNKNNNHNKHIVIMEMKKVKTNQMNRNANIKCIGQTKPKKNRNYFLLYCDGLI